jgi:hypothetical protein
MTTLAEIRAKLKEQENNSSGNSSPRDNAIYPFWNIKDGEQATLRFLPDGNTDNTFFWEERLVIKLPFTGIKGQTDSRPCIVQVPCMEMYGESCPVLTEVRPWFKDPNLEDMGRKYWKKRSYIFQGFVTQDPMDEKDGPDNPIRRFIIGPQIFKLIKGALMDPDMEELPTDYTGGVDFRIDKGTKGGYADYGSSSWARRDRPLSEDDMKAIEDHGLQNLSDFLPKKPDAKAIEIIKEMFEASVDGEPYDEERWGNYFKPAGMQAATGSKTDQKDTVGEKSTTPAKEKVDEKVDEKATEKDDSAPWNADDDKNAKQEDTKSAGNDAQDILSMIRSRQNQS